MSVASSSSSSSSFSSLFSSSSSSSPLFSSPLLVSSPRLLSSCSLPDFNHDHPRPVCPAGPQPRPSTPSVPCRTSTASIRAQCSLPDLNHDHPRPVFPAGPQPRPSTPIHAQCSLPDLNREYPRQVFPAGPHVGRYGTKNVQKNVRKNVRQVCYILLANSRVCGRVTCLLHMFKQTCWELWSLLHMAHWHVYILFDRLTCTMTCQVKQMIGIVSWAKVPWQKLQTKVVSTSCFEMSWWGSLEAK